jgi:hypothetical protein
MNPEMGRQLRHRRVAAQRRKCDLGLESRIVFASTRENDDDVTLILSLQSA